MEATFNNKCALLLNFFWIKNKKKQKGPKYIQPTSRPVSLSSLCRCTTSLRCGKWNARLRWRSFDSIRQRRRIVRLHTQEGWWTDILLEALTRDASVRDFCRKKALVIKLHNAAGGEGGRPVSSCSFPPISCNCGQLSHTAANRTSHTCEKKDKKENRAAQPPGALSSAAASSPDQLMQSRCRSTVHVGAARRSGDLW